MKTLLSLLALLSVFTLSAQTTSPNPSSGGEKGATPLTAPAPAPVTRAVVVGIYDYQDPAIPDLRFADRDAEAFANFLRSPAGGTLTNDQMTLLTNAQATTAQFDAALGWLMDESKEGDQAIVLKNLSPTGFRSVKW